MEKELYVLLDDAARKLCERISIESGREGSGYVDLPRLVEATAALIKEIR